MPVKSNNDRKNSIWTLNNITFVLFCILLAYGPFFRGLYFETELLPTHIFSFALALVWLISKYNKKEYKLIKSPIDITAIGIVFMYFISIFYAVSTRLAILELLKYANYFFVFLLARDLSENEKYKKWILNTLVISAVGVSIVGIGSFIETWNYNGAVMGDRIASTFQYPNTLASYLAAIFIIALGLFIIEEKKINRVLYGACSNILLFTFILTYSRGMWLILPFMILLYIIAIPNKKKLELITFLSFNVIIAIGFSMLFTQVKLSSNYIQWLVFVLAPIVMGGITYIVSLIKNKFDNITFNLKKLLLVVIILSVIFGSGIFYAFTKTVPLKIENNLTEDKWTTVYRSVNNVKENKNYALLVSYTSLNKEDKPYTGHIRVYSVDNKGNLEILKKEQLTQLNETYKQIEFTTSEKTDTIRIYFDNYYTGTSITYNDAKIIDTDNNEVIKKLKLKYKYIPETIIRRIDSISADNNSVQARLTFYNDGFKVIKDYPILGTGGGGWKKLYTMYQSYGYTTSQAHNYFIKIWIEVGFIGFILFILFLVMLTYYTFKKWLTIDIEKNRCLIATFFIAVVSLLAHAFIDFDLSLVALSFVLWVLAGMLSSYITYNKKNKAKRYKSDKSKIQKVVAIILFSLLFINSVSLTLGNMVANNVSTDINKGDTDKAIKTLNNVAFFDPYKAEYKADLAILNKLKYHKTKEEEYIIKALEQMNKAQDIGKYNINVKAIGASFYISIGQIDKGLALVNDIVKLQPIIINSYLQKSNAYLSVFNYYLKQKKDSEKAKQTIDEAYKIKEQIKEINLRADKPLEYNEELLYKLGYIQFYKENFHNNQYNIDSNYALAFAYYFDLDIDGNGTIDMLRQWNSEDGQVSYELLKEENSYIRITNKGESYGIVYPYGLKLKPDSKYKIFIKARGNVNDDTFKLFVYDSKAEKKAQATLENINFTNDWSILQLKFETDSDIKPGTQYLRLQHNGKDEGYVDIEEVIIFKEIK